jgi:hypothetical protein
MGRTPSKEVPLTRTATIGKRMMNIDIVDCSDYG